MTLAAAPVVVITGGSSGIGRCVALLFARRGWRVGLVARGEAGLRAACAAVEAAGGTAAWAVADVADAHALGRAADALHAALGPPDVWVNNAGNGAYGLFTTVGADVFRQVTDVTYGGTVNGTRAALRSMRARNRGVVVNVCSAIAFHGVPLLTSYSGAKRAVQGFTRAVRADLQDEGSAVRVCLVYPPAANTPFFSHAAMAMGPGFEAVSPRPMRPVYQPEVVADGVWHAARTGRDVPVGGVTVAFGWLSRLAPGLVARLIGLMGTGGQMTRCRRAMAARNPALWQANGRHGAGRGPFGARGWSAQMLALQAWKVVRGQ